MQNYKLFRARDFHIDLSTPKLMGILNLTPDSFSDGGRFFSQFRIDADLALEVALQMQQDGAAIIDIGGESTRPGSEPISTDEELRRTIPVIELLSRNLNIPLSIDTYKSTVADKALQKGASMVNDVSGFKIDPSLADICAKFQVPAVVMHSRQKPSEMQWSYDDQNTYDDLLTEILSSLQYSINFGKSKGVNSFIVDVGFGFGKNVEGNFYLLSRLNEVKSLGYPILAGLSRKSFIGKVIHRDLIASVEERLYGTIAANVIAMQQGASILRVHDVKPNMDAIQVYINTFQTPEQEG